MVGDLRVLTNLARAAAAGEGETATLVPRLCASLAESLALECVDIVLAEDRGVEEIAVHPALREALECGQPVCRGGRLAVPLLAPGGAIGFLAADCDEQPSDEHLELFGAAGAMTAVLVQRAIELDELDRLSRLKSQFIALASHELRAPAAVIHGVAKTIVTHAKSITHEQLESLHATLADHTDRLARLIEELLDLSRLEAKVIAIEREPLRVRRRLDDVVRAVAGDRSQEVVVDVSDELCPPVDPTAFDRIVGNLVANALRYGRAPISIHAAQNDRHFRLSVEDHGDGVSPAFVPHLFERFSRERPGRAEQGSGLGLSIAQAYANAHGGQVFYEDATPHGARFQLVLPAHQ